MKRRQDALLVGFQQNCSEALSNVSQNFGTSAPRLCLKLSPGHFSQTMLQRYAPQD
jgi:hypothetical protein